MFRYYTLSVILDSIQIILMWSYSFPEAFSLHRFKYACKTLQYLGFLVFQINALLNVVISIDRYMNVKYAYKYLIRNKFKFQIIVFLIIILLSSGFCFSYFYFSEIIFVFNTTYCGIRDPFIRLYTNSTDTFFAVLLPFFIMSSLTCVTGCSLIKQKMSLNKIKFDKEIQMLKLLLVMDFLFVLSNLPIALYSIINNILNIQGKYPSYMKVVYTITDFFVYLYSSCSFFVHFSCNKNFRKYTLEMVCMQPVNKGQIQENHRVRAAVSQIGRLQQTVSYKNKESSATLRR